jgi:hypothetical protein
MRTIYSTEIFSYLHCLHAAWLFTKPMRGRSSICYLLFCAQDPPLLACRSSRYTLQLSFPKRSAKKALVRVPRCQQHPGSSASLVEQSADDDRDAAAHQTVLQESNGAVTKAADALAAPAHADDAVPQSASEAAEGASAQLGDSLTEPLLKPDDDKAQPAEAAVASVLLENGDEELSLTDGIKR